MTPRYAELAAKVDAFHERVRARHPGALTCHAGCSACCHQHLSVVPLEFARIAAAVGRLDAASREALDTRLAHGRDDPRCPLLDDAGRCRVYEARPLLCRSHGLPVSVGALGACREKGESACEPEVGPDRRGGAGSGIPRNIIDIPQRFRNAEMARHRTRRRFSSFPDRLLGEPPRRDVCPLNFREGPPLGALDAEVVLDVDHLNRLLGVLQHVEGGGPGTRVDLIDALRALLSGIERSFTTGPGGLE